MTNWTQSKVDSALEKAHGAFISMSEISRSVLGGNVDEVALLFCNQGCLKDFVQLAVRHEGYSLFNTARDQVHTGPIPGYYTVEYWFLSTPYQYRIECMAVVSGHSPLHAAVEHLRAERMEEDPAVIHASVKVASDEEYASATFALRNELVLHQECISDYGLFSYWRPHREPQANDEITGCYLKPRVNMRDAS